MLPTQPLLNDIDRIPAPGDVHLWLTPCAETLVPGLTAEYEQLMSDEERAQARRFVFAADAHRYVVTRALVRTVMSRYLQVPPKALRFERTAYGRPFLLDEVHGELSFNLSHTRELVVCAVGRGGVVGVDTEGAGRERAPLEIANRYFSAAESRSLDRLAAPLRDRRFYEIWTLKEAYVKAEGQGLQLGLDTFQLDLDTDGVIGISFSPELDASPASCHFWMFDGPCDHLVSVCWRGSHGTPRLASQTLLVPMHSEQSCELPLLRKSAVPITA